MSLQGTRQCLALASARTRSEGDVSAVPVCGGWRSCSACCIPPHPSALGTSMPGQLQLLGLVRVKSPAQSLLPPAHQLCCCHCLWDQTPCSLQAMSSGRVDAAPGGIAAGGFVQSGRTSYSRMYKPFLLPPAPPSPWVQGVPGTPGPMQDQMCRRFVVSGLGPLSGLRAPVPFQTLPLARPAPPLDEVRRWPWKRWGQFRISPDPLFDKIPACRLASSLIGHGWISGFTLAGCPGGGRLLPGEEGSRLQR